MTREETDARLDEYRGAWATVASRHRDAIILGLVRQAGDAFRMTGEADVNQLFGLGMDTVEFGRASLGAALALGWPGPVVEGEGGDE